MNLSCWITNWQKILTDAKRVSPPEADELRSTQALLETIQTRDSPFSDYWAIKMEVDARINSLE